MLLCQGFTKVPAPIMSALCHVLSQPLDGTCAGVKNWTLRSSVLGMLRMLLNQDDSPSVEPGHWDRLGAIFADARAEPDRLDLAAIASLADIASTVAAEGADALAELRLCKAPQHLAVMLLHTLVGTRQAPGSWPAVIDDRSSLSTTVGGNYVVACTYSLHSSW